jgi:hypothetical protein
MTKIEINVFGNSCHELIGYHVIRAGVSKAYTPEQNLAIHCTLSYQTLNQILTSIWTFCDPSDLLIGIAAEYSYAVHYHRSASPLRVRGWYARCNWQLSITIPKQNWTSQFWSHRCLMLQCILTQTNE